MRSFPNIEKRHVHTGEFPARDWPYRGYSSRIFRCGADGWTDAIFLITRINPRGWAAWGLINDEPKGTMLEAKSLAEMSRLLEELEPTSCKSR